jgi:Ca2+-binding EF-hand superfamily protein
LLTINSGYKNILGPHKAEEEVNKIMTEVDKNGSGSIDYSGNNNQSS